MPRVRALVASAVLLSASAAIAGESTQRPVLLQDVPLTIGTPGEIPTRVPSESGGSQEIKIRVNRIWRAGPRTHAAVRLQNTARVAFNDVSVICTAVDAENRQIGSQRQELPRGRSGSFPPGSIADLDLVFETPKSEVRSLTCDARARGLPRFVD